MKFSIITPSFNQGSFLGQTIESVITQRGDFEIEYYVMDGGSTDESVELLKTYQQKIGSGQYQSFNQGVKFYFQSQKDNGQSDAINQGLRKISGDIVAYLNSDDTYPEDTFKKVADAFKSHPNLDWLTGYCGIIDQDNQPVRSFVERYKNFWLRHYSFNKLLVINFVSQPATFWRSEVLTKVGYFDESLHYTMDYDYWLRLAKTSQLIVVREKLAHFRVHKSSKGETAYHQQFAQDYLVVKQYTQNHWLRFLHALHNQLILGVYRSLK